MIKIGLIGGIASGKSLVAKYLADLGADVFDADQVCHDLLENDPVVIRQLMEHWGPKIMSQAGTADRQKLGQLVFDDKNQGDENRKKLEAILHPAAHNRLQRQVKEVCKRAVPVIVIDAPLLVEAGWDSECDLLIFVETTEESRLQNVHARGWDKNELAARERAQLSISVKKESANVCLENNGDKEDLRKKVKKVWQQYVRPSLEAN